ncbi:MULTISPECIES: hypothetical protein [Streptomyces]|uniref:Integral membrane protein n=1 Tax=Streptomyces solicathayae TaxID=3081768 RepID=A0ABZ0LP75_9ACTN|nr:hypothetical protein [Streptomyces sp. HUAS YS2]WOX20623.1 hypothetical protein R2D22_04125 [Streptomyces sp. HUAS YS2]
MTDDGILSDRTDTTGDVGTDGRADHDRILAVCRSNWEYRGVDDASVREMIEELSAHLRDAEAAGRTARDVVGDDVPAFAAAWARGRAPLHRRALRLAAMALFAVGLLWLLRHLIRWTTELPVDAADLAFWGVIATVTVAWEMRRGSLGLGKSWLLAFAVGLPTALLTRFVAGEGTLFTLPLWAAPLLILPALPYIVADERARRAEAPAGA